MIGTALRFTWEREKDTLFLVGVLKQLFLSVFTWGNAVFATEKTAKVELVRKTRE